MMSLALATLLAATAALLGNRMLFGLKGRWALATLVPLWEEICKGLAVWALPGRPILAIHLLFGLLEFAYSAWRGERFLGLVGLSVHGLTGGVVAWLAGGGAPGAEALGLAVVGAGLLHMALNRAVLGMVFPTLGLPGLTLNVHVDPRPEGRYNEQE